MAATIDTRVTQEQKEYCDLMKYEFVRAEDTYFIYKIPQAHICKFLLNFIRWRETKRQNESLSNIKCS